MGFFSEALRRIIFREAGYTCGSCNEGPRNPLSRKTPRLEAHSMTGDHTCAKHGVAVCPECHRGPRGIHSLSGQQFTSSDPESSTFPQESAAVESITREVFQMGSLALVNQLIDAEIPEHVIYQLAKERRF